MKTLVMIEWDEPKIQEWLCADNISLALHAYCANTKFKVLNLDPDENYGTLVKHKQIFDSGPEPVGEK